MNYVLCWTNFLHVFTLDQTFGPLLIMLKKMATDVKNFAILVVAFLTGFSFAFYTFRELFPQFEVSVLKEFLGVFNLMFYSLIGVFDNTIFDEISNPVLRSFLQILLAVYIIISLITLFNLLIAMMGTTYGEVQEESFKEFRFNFANECWGMTSEPTILPPPFTLFVALTSLPFKLYHFFKPPHESSEWVCYICHQKNSRDPQVSKEFLLSFRKKHRALLPGFDEVCSRCNFFKREAGSNDILHLNISCVFLWCVGLPLRWLVFFYKKKPNVRKFAKNIRQGIVTATTVLVPGDNIGSEQKKDVDESYKERLEWIDDASAESRRNLWVERNLKKPEPSPTAMLDILKRLNESVEAISHDVVKLRVEVAYLKGKHEEMEAKTLLENPYTDAH